MKKIVSLLLLSAMLLAFAGCEDEFKTENQGWESEYPTEAEWRDTVAEWGETTPTPTKTPKAAKTAKPKITPLPLTTRK